jgi:hypothetical protein
MPLDSNYSYLWSNVVDKSRLEQLELDYVIRQEVIDERITVKAGSVLLEYLQERRKEIEALDVPAVTLGRRAPWCYSPEHGRIWGDVKRQLEGRLTTDDIKKVELSSTRLVNQLAAPALEHVDSRGLVIGNVQSGKTTSFTSLSAMAMDGGYQILIVLAGTTNFLRKQTQKRMNREFVIQGGAWFSLTDLDNDFAHQTSSPLPFMQATDRKTILVVKKNPTVLNRVINWFKLAPVTERQRCPVLIVDDEADQASVNTARGNARRTAINRLLLETLETMPNSAYVGYTATPFANVLIDPTIQQDLYPRSFISVLETPPAYFGSERMFGRPPMEEEDFEVVAELDIRREISNEDAEALQPKPRQVNAFCVNELPESLTAAIEYFVLSCAAREKRQGGLTHMTMLIHTTAMARAHEVFRAPVSAYVNKIISAVRTKDLIMIEKLKKRWEEECSKVSAQQFENEEVSFNSILAKLSQHGFNVDVLIENYLSEDDLEFDDENPKRQIVIGGNILSRGVTLEGLNVSYYARKVKAYDTLLQMGRWFGYRKGYEDYVRIWMTNDLFDWFRDVALVEQEIRRDIANYKNQNLTPLEATVRIRTHPQMLITAKNKMHAAVTVKGSYADRKMQMRHVVYKGNGVPERNFSTTDTFIRSLGMHSSSDKKGFQWDSIVAEKILSFLNEFNFPAASGDVGSASFREYVRKRVKNVDDAWNQWQVRLINIASNEVTEKIGEYQVRLANRSRLGQDVPETGLGPGVKIGDIGALVPEEDWSYGSAGYPTLLIYAINPKSKSTGKGRVDLEADTVVIALAIRTPAVYDETDVDRVTVLPPGEQEEIDEENDNELAEIEAAEATEGILEK